MQTQFVNLLLIPIKISDRTTALSRQKVHLIIRIDCPLRGAKPSP